MIKLIVNDEKYYNEIYNLVSLFYPDISIGKHHTDGNIFQFIVDVEKEKITFNARVDDTDFSFEDKIVYDDILSSDKRLLISVKHSVVRLLSKIKSVELPWGVLTGVRPIKLVHSIIDSGISNREALFKTLCAYGISDENINNIIDIAYRQRELVYPLNKNKICVYINIPFCPSKCRYCSFKTLVPKENDGLIADYLKILEFEILSLKQYLSGFEIECIYIGGGTPTTLNEKELESLLKIINEYFDLSSLREFTVEAGRPDTINADKLKVLKDYGVDRISINPQTMNPKTLLTVNRTHSVADFYNAYNSAKSTGFKTINTDLIIGLENEGLKEFKNTITEIIKLAPENLTVHTLSLKKGSNYKTSYVLQDSDTIYDMMNYSKSYCKENGYLPYYLYRQKNILGNLENIGYSLKGHECFYNVAMMEERRTILSFGMGAISKFFFPDEDRHERQANFNDKYEYSKRINEIIEKKIINIKML